MFQNNQNQHQTQITEGILKGLPPNLSMKKHRQNAVLLVSAGQIQTVKVVVQKV